MDYPTHKLVNGEQVPLTKQEIADLVAFWTSNKEEAESKEYINKRISEYPSITDQLDMLFKAMESGEIPKATMWFDKIKSIRDKYPRPKQENK